MSRSTMRIPMVVKCETQDEIDRLWAALLDGGGGEQQCGWPNDRYGLSRQFVPAALHTMLTGGDAEAADRAMAAVMGTVKLDIAQFEAAHRGPLRRNVERGRAGGRGYTNGR